MPTRVFTLAFDPATEHFNDEPVRQFLADKEVLSVHDHFFVKDGLPYLALVACYRPGTAAPAPGPSTDRGARQRDESWRDDLTKDDWPLFNTLRDWRSERSKRDGVPHYVICTNRQLTAVVTRRPATLAELGQIEGFGEAKLKKYGREMLAILGRAGPRAAAAGAEPDHAPA
jgi:superfamily II DNA helicase RecQ